MTRKMSVPAETLAVLNCEIGVRPEGAPTLDDLAPALRCLRREEESLAIEFDPAAAAAVAAFAAAERRCCAGIGWEVESGDTLTLRVRAAPDQLDLLAQLWQT